MLPRNQELNEEKTELLDIGPYIIISTIKELDLSDTVSIITAFLTCWGGSVAIFGNFWQPLFLEILKIHVKSCQKLPKIAESCQK